MWQIFDLYSKKHLNTSLSFDRRFIAIFYEIGIAESNANVKILRHVLRMRSEDVAKISVPGRKLNRRRRIQRRLRKYWFCRLVYYVARNKSATSGGLQVAVRLNCHQFSLLYQWWRYVDDTVFMYTDTVDRLLITVTVWAVVKFGWTAFSAVVRKQVLRSVDTAAGEITTAITVKMSLSHATHRLSQTVCSSKKTVI